MPYPYDSTSFDLSTSSAGVGLYDGVVGESVGPESVWMTSSTTPVVAAIGVESRSFSQAPRRIATRVRRTVDLLCSQFLQFHEQFPSPPDPVGLIQTVGIRGYDGKVCVCTCPPVSRGSVLITRYQSLNLSPNDIPSIPWARSTTPLDPRGIWREGFPTSPCILVGTPWQLLGGSSTT